MKQTILVTGASSGIGQFNVKVTMIEPQYFKTNIGSNAITATGEVKDYDTFRQNINAYYSKELEKAPEPKADVDTVMKIINEKHPKFSYPVGKGSSLILTLQRFA